MMKKLLILGGSRYIIPVIKTAHELNIYVITCDYLPVNIGHCYSDEYHNVSIIDKNAVLKLAKELEIDGIMSFATDPGVIVAAYVAEQMGLPFCPYKSVEILQSKDLFRNFLRENGFCVPLAFAFSRDETYENQIEQMRFPVIVKPVDSAGSKGVTKVENMDSLNSAIQHALGYSRSGRYIIEEFIQQAGCSSDSDCFSIDNELVCASFSCQYFDSSAINPYTPSAYSWPSDMPVNKIKELRNEIQRLIKLLNLGTSIYNVETRVGIDGRAYIMEVSPRGGGNRLAEMVCYASGENIIKNNILAAVGMEVLPMSDPVYDGVWAEYIIHSNTEGIFRELYVKPGFEKYIFEKDLWVKLGDKVNTFTGANETIGTLILKFDSAFEMKEKLNHISNYIKVVVE